MKITSYILAFLATTALLGATFAAVHADESTGTGTTSTGTTSTGVTSTGTTSTGVTSTGTTNTGTTSTGVTSTGSTTGTGIIRIIRHEMRDDRHEVRDMRHEGMQQVKELCYTLKQDNKKNKEECKDARKVMKEEIKKAAHEVKRVLSQKTRDLFNSKLDAIPTDNKVTLYTKVLAKLDVLLAQPRTEKVKNMLLELKAIVQARLDAVQAGISEIDIINEVLAQ